jgi:uncharacterized membrane protein YfcA
MTGAPLFFLILIFLATSAISVVTGSTSLITVPAMFQFHIDPRTAVATNMFALTCMSAGGALPFLRGQAVDRKRLPLLIVLTLAGSAIGAFLLLLVPARSVTLIVSVAMIAVALFCVLYRKSGLQDAAGTPSASAEIVCYILTFLLGIYGGFFSGGYVTLLTAVYVGLFRMSFVQAIATTKIINVFSSAVATGIFMQHRLIDYRLGVILGIAMFTGALFGARLAVHVGNLWLRRIFLTAVWALGLKALLFNLFANNAGRSILSNTAE